MSCEKHPTRRSRKFRKSSGRHRHSSFVTHVFNESGGNRDQQWPISLEPLTALVNLRIFLDPIYVTIKCSRGLCWRETSISRKETTGRKLPRYLFLDFLVRFFTSGRFRFRSERGWNRLKDEALSRIFWICFLCFWRWYCCRNGIYIIFPWYGEATQRRVQCSLLALFFSLPYLIIV